MFRVLAFTVKPVDSADSRYRILQYQSVFGAAEIRVDHYSLMGPRYFRWQIEHANAWLRVALYPFLWIARLVQVVFLAPDYDAVWISREMAPLGPPIFEHLLVRRAQRVILDIDDALHISDKETASLIPRLLRDRSKYSRMAGAYSAIVCGNDYLADYYRQWSQHVYVIPTVIDTARYSSVVPGETEIVRIGWVGTPLNRHYLESIRPALEALARERSFELVVVGLNEQLGWDLPHCRCLKWRLSEELEFFSAFDIGIMPLQDSSFARGKCAFKLIQYMAAGLPVVASPVGANLDVVRVDVNGFLAGTNEEWQTTLRALIDDPGLRRAFGENGREMARQRFSLDASWPLYAEILQGKSVEQPICAA